MTYTYYTHTHPHIQMETHCENHVLSAGVLPVQVVKTQYTQVAYSTKYKTIYISGVNLKGILSEQTL